MLIFILGSVTSLIIGAIIILGITKFLSGTLEIVVHYIGVYITIIGMIASFTIPFFLPKDIEKIYTETEKKELILLENDTFLLYRNNSYH